MFGGMIALDTEKEDDLEMFLSSPAPPPKPSRYPKVADLHTLKHTKDPNWVSWVDRETNITFYVNCLQHVQTWGPPFGATVPS